MGASPADLFRAVFVVAISAYVYTIVGPSFFDGGGGSAVVMSGGTADIDGMSFPTDLKVAGARQSLVGGGTRSKWGFKVYAVGIYSEPSAVKSLKKKHGDDVVNSAVLKDFSEGKQAKTLLLRFHREVAASDMSEALGEALVDKVGEETSKEFSDMILGMVGRASGDKLKKGSDLYIACKGQKLLASLSDTMKDADTISKKGLCSAIFMVYLGDKPVSPQAKEGFENGFREL